MPGGTSDGWIRENSDEPPCRVGEYYPLIRRGASNLKYDHHPIAAIQALAAMPSFRHMNIEQLTAAVLKWGCVRSNPWGGFARKPDAFDLAWEREIDLKPTIARVALHCGACCHTCDALVCEAMEAKPDNWDLWQTFDDRSNQQRAVKFAMYPQYASIKDGASFPVFCQSCWGSASSLKHHHWNLAPLVKILEIIEAKVAA